MWTKQIEQAEQAYSANNHLRLWQVVAPAKKYIVVASVEETAMSRGLRADQCASAKVTQIGWNFAGVPAGTMYLETSP